MNVCSWYRWVWREFFRFCLSFLGRHGLFLEVLENKIFLLNVIKVFTFFVIFSVLSNRGIDQSWLLLLSSNKNSQMSSMNRKFWLNHCELILVGALLSYLVTITRILKSLWFLVCWIRFTPVRQGSCWQFDTKDYNEHYCQKDKLHSSYQEI